MFRLVPFLPILLLSACGPSGPPEPFHGDWKVSSVITPGVSAQSPADAGRLVGTVVSLQPGRVRVGERTCSGAIYTRRALSVETFTEAYRVTPQQLSLTADPIALVDVTCESGALELGSTLVLKTDTAMLTMWDGVFYMLTKAS
jgi:hypothetical protein